MFVWEVVFKDKLYLIANKRQLDKKKSDEIYVEELHWSLRKVFEIQQNNTHN